MKRILVQGAVYGLAAGVLFGLVEILAAVLMNASWATPLVLFASVILGSEALTLAGPGTLVIGALTHLALSTLFGLVYAAVAGAFLQRILPHYAAQAGIGALFGLGLWFVNFQLIARAFYPWFLDTPQVMQAMMHALFFGLPLGLMLASSERRMVRTMHVEPTPA